MKKVLITGASGFVGRHCLPLLLSKGYEVHALSRHGPSQTFPDISWHEIDLLLPGSARKLIARVRPDMVLHLAWYAVPGKFWEAPENLDWVRASVELLDTFVESGGKRIVAAGSCAEYGIVTGECLENSTPQLPISLYGTSKHTFEKMLRASHQRTGLSSAWGRLFFMYGPHEHPSRIVAYAIRSLLAGEPVLCSNGEQILDFMHVEDAASAFVALLESDVQGSVNIASGNPVSLRRVLEEVARQLGHLEMIRFGARPSSSEPDRFWANTQRLLKEVNWTPRFDLAGGIDQTIKWWRSAVSVSTSDAGRHGSL